MVVKKTLYVFALVLALSAAAFGVFASSPSNVMAKDTGDGVSASL